MEFNSQIAAPLTKLEEGLTKTLYSAELPMQQINNHLLTVPGKRLRPALFFLVLGMWDQQPDPHLPVALAIELIHTATLVHDDVVDSAETRRGQFSLNATWGNHTAVLTGDYLFAKAFNLLSEYGNIHIIREMAGLVEDMSEGEILQQRDCFQSDLSEEDYFRRIGKKTARFFSVSARCAGLVSHVSDDQLNALAEYGYYAGIAFQLIDDLLDFFGAEEVTGKLSGSDLRQGVLTLPVLRLLDVSPQKKKLAAKIATRNIDDDFLAEIKCQLQNYECSEYVRQKARDYVRNATDSLNKLPPHPCRETLSLVAEYIVRQ